MQENKQPTPDQFEADFSDPVEVDPRDQRGKSFGLALMGGFGAHNKHVYGFTVSPDEVKARRHKAKAARAARRANRRSGQ